MNRVVLMFIASSLWVNNFYAGNACDAFKVFVGTGTGLVTYYSFLNLKSVVAKEMAPELKKFKEELGFSTDQGLFEQATSEIRKAVSTLSSNNAKEDALLKKIWLWGSSTVFFGYISCLLIVSGLKS